ncbi:hypothetical protein HED60_05215 [Planctomycetales bacterium ZRK34]|nr:hypothetical protein HED60_05215 [Planctomycetales bacterium ZRK34]
MNRPPAALPVLFPVLLVLTAGLLAIAGATSARAESLDQVVERLTAEAKQLSELKDPKPRPVFKRPHIRLDNPEKHVAEVLQTMSGKLTGNIYYDTYIRWHLIDQILHVESDDLSYQKDRIIALINNMPAGLSMPRKDEGHHEPPEPAAEFWNLYWGDGRVVIGYPPFQRVYHFEEALKHAPADRKAELEKIVKRMRELRKQFKWVPNPGAAQYNDRIEKMDWIIRSYRGELIYLLLRTGDPAVPGIVIREIGKQVEKKQRTALDLLNYLYMAALNGDLARYDQAVIENAGRALERLARSADGYQVYDTGPMSRDRFWSKQPRNFADYAFTIVHMMQNGSVYRLD